MKLLEPYFAGEEPSIRGEDKHRELDMYCPLHEDNKRSATLDLDKGLWYCHAGCGGGTVQQLISQKDEWVPPRRGGGHSRNGNGASNGQPAEQVTEGKVRGWASNLISDSDRLEELMSRRGLDEDTIESYEIGWDSSARAYTIPIRDTDGTILNVRRYQFDPPDERRKIWSVKGMGSPARLYPVDQLEEDTEEIVVCEGEWDALLTIQQGFTAITRTAAAGVWDAEWGTYFQGKRVYLIHDMDDAGQDANKKIARMLEKVCDVRVVRLPYPVEKKHGKDLSDYWLEGHSPRDFRRLLDEATPAAAGEDEGEVEPEELPSIADTLDAKRVGKPVRVNATVKGRKEPGYIIPRKVHMSCTRDEGSKCKICPMNAAGGECDYTIKASDPATLKMLGKDEKAVGRTIAEKFGVPGARCSKLEIQSVESQSVEILFGRQSLEYSTAMDEYKTIKVTAIGNHKTPVNATYAVTGALFPNPNTQENEFLAWDVKPLKTTLDTFELTPAQAKQLRKFRPRKGQRPLKRLGYIARDLEAHVTKIYGRPEMHAAMDLIFHSVLSFNFGGQRIERGWLEGLFVGDTRTGKSETAERLVQHYQAGEVINCESATFAGIVGGLQQYGGKEWSISWGAIPLNDRRLVVLDEISGLTYEQIAAMSDVRSRGVAQLTKIQQEATHARTRLIWVGNPRDGGMQQYTYGVQAIKPLVGNPEDIARFDLAMTAASSDVPSEDINREYEDAGEAEFPSVLCSLLVRWVWSRRPDQVVWANGAEAAVYAAAQQLGERYTDVPPLVQAASVRVKVARMAVALAARLFSTDENYENVMVRKEHVWDAVAFLDRLYSMPGFGYAELSKQRIAARQEARANKDDIRKWLMTRPGMATFLRENPSFKRQDLEEVMNLAREEANAVINTLFHARMVRKDQGKIYVEPVLHELIREVRR